MVQGFSWIIGCVQASGRVLWAKCLLRPLRSSGILRTTQWKSHIDEVDQDTTSTQHGLLIYYTYSNSSQQTCDGYSSSHGREGWVVENLSVHLASRPRLHLVVFRQREICLHHRSYCRSRRIDTVPLSADACYTKHTSSTLRAQTASPITPHPDDHTSPHPLNPSSQYRVVSSKWFRSPINALSKASTRWPRRPSTISPAPPSPTTAARSLASLTTGSPLRKLVLRNTLARCSPAR
jgi:hypothetical protein